MKKFSISGNSTNGKGKSRLSSSRMSTASKTGYYGIQNGLEQNSIDNLSTLRASEANEREKKLHEKIKQLKLDNSKLILLLKESETIVTQRLQ